MLTRRAFLGLAASQAALALVARRALALPVDAPPRLTVYKSPSCGCCTKWVEHLTANGFAVDAKNMDDVSEIKRSLGVPQALWSCHTGVIDGYAIEGHVPAKDIKRLRAQRPKVVGLAVPGMPMGSPGMEGPRKDAYDVIAFDRAGKTSVFSRH